MIPLSMLALQSGTVTLCMRQRQAPGRRASGGCQGEGGGGGMAGEGEQMRAAAHRMDKQGPAVAQGTTLNTLRQTTTERSTHACACAQLNPSVVPQKPTSHCRSTALHLSKVT